MGSLTSTLKFRLIDGVSGPARQVSGSLKTLHADAKRAAGPKGLAGFMAGGLGINLPGLAAGAAAYTAGSAVKEAVTQYAALERQMTRIGITAGASRTQVAAATEDIRRIADEVAISFDDARGGVEALVAQGRSLPDAMSFLPAVARTAQASGASVEHIARSAGAIAISLGVSARDMEAAFDAMAAGGKFGQFELRDMAEYLPRIAASASKLGYAGVDGVKRIVALAQVVRDVSGTSENAAIGMIDAFEKILSPTVQKAFAKRGVDLTKVLQKAAKEGVTGFEAVVEQLDEMTAKMDDVQREQFISSIFTEADSRRAISAILKHRDRYNAALRTMANSAGTVARDVNRVLTGPQAALDRLSTAWTGMLTSLGRTADGVGATKGLSELKDMLDGIAEVLEDIERRGLGIGNLPNMLGRRFGQWAEDQIKAWADEQFRVDPARDLRKQIDFLKGRHDPSTRTGALAINRPIDAYDRDRRAGLTAAERELAGEEAAAERRKAQIRASNQAFPEIGEGEIRALDNRIATLRANVARLREEIAGGLPVDRVPVPPVRGGAQRRSDSYLPGAAEVPMPRPRPAPGGPAAGPLYPPNLSRGAAQRRAEDDPDWFLRRLVGAPERAVPPARRSASDDLLSIIDSDWLGKPPSRPTAWKPNDFRSMPTFNDAGGERLGRELDGLDLKVRALDSEMKSLLDPSEFGAVGTQAMQSLATGIAAGSAQVLGELQTLRAQMERIIGAPLRVSVQASGSVSGGGGSRIAPAPAGGGAPGDSVARLGRNRLSDFGPWDMA